MAKNLQHFAHIKSTNTAITSGDSVFIASGQTGPQLPTADKLIQGEIAVNLAKDVETLSIKNTSGEIVTFSSDKIIKKVIVDNERITAAALNDLEINKQDVLTPGSGISIVNNVISSTVEDVTVDDALSSTSENPVQNKVINNALSSKVNSATYTAYTANTASILSGKQDTMSAGTNISIDDNVISTTFDIDTELSSSSTNPVANSAITKVIEENELITAAALNDLEEKKLDASAYTPTDLSDLYILSGKVDDNAFVAAAALNDLNERLYGKLDATAYTPTDLSDYYDKDEVDTLVANRVSSVTINNVTKASTNGNVNLGPVVSSMTVNGSAVTVTNGAAAITGVAAASDLLKYADKAEYVSNDKKIYFKNGNTILTSMTIDATAFIKDGMVNDVEIGTPTSGSNSGVTCLIVTFNTDAGKEDIEIPLSQIFDSNLYYTKTEIDDKLGSGFTGENSGNTVTKVIEDNELAISAALNDLNDRKLDASAYTPTDLSDLYVLSGVVNESSIVTAEALNDLNERLYDKLDASAYTEVEVDEELSSSSTNPVANSAITKTILENEEVVSEALADLDSRISGNTTYINQVNAKADTIARSLSGYTPSGYSYSKGEVEVKLNDKLDASAYTPTDLSGYYTKQEIDNDKLGSGFTGANSGITVTQAINETETVVSAALNDLNDRIDSLGDDIDALEAEIQNIDIPTIDGDVSLWSSGSTGVPATSALSEVLEEIEEVTSTALNDLNERLVDVEENQLTPSSFKTINNESIIGSGNIEIQGGGGGEMNVITGVSVNGTAASVSNKVANITSVSASIVATSSTLNFVSSNEKTTWNNVTAKTDTTAFTQHTGDTTAHVTSAEKSTWNGKQDALSCGELKGTMNRSDVSGSGSISIKNTSGEFPTVVTAGTYKVVTYMSSTTQSYGLNVTFGGNAYSLTTSNGVIEDEREITITSNKTWSASVSGTVAANTVLIVKLYLISSNVSVLGLVAVSNDYDDLYNKPTIPTSLSDINSAHTHSEYALNTAFTAHTASTTAHVTSAEKTQWNNAISGVSFNGTDATVTNGKAAISAETGTEIVYLRLEYDNSAGTYKYDGTDTVLTADQIISLLEDKTKEVVLVYTISIWAENVHFYLRNKEVNVDDNYVSYKFSNVIQWTQETTPYQTFYQLRGINILHPTNTTPTTIYTSLDIFNLTPNTSFTAHTADTTAHVTSAEKSTWNGKQDAFSNASVLSGISSTNVTNWNNAATSAHSHSNKSVLDNLTQAVITNSHTHSNKSVLDGIAATNLLPAVTASDNGKILMVVNGAWALVNPTTIYTGTGTPSGSQGNDGDIYLQTS